MDDFSEKDPYAGMSIGMKIIRKYFMLPHAIHPQSKLMILLVLIQWIALMYNAWAIPLRFCFHIYVTEDTAMYWLIADYSMDLIYIFDTVGMKMLYKVFHEIYIPLSNTFLKYSILLKKVLIHQFI